MSLHISFERLKEVLESDEDTGFCISCGEEADCVEPDARRYTCESCGENSVYGAEEILFLSGDVKVKLL